MRRIEEYIEKIYRGFDKKDEETKILKEETKAHLFEEVEDLKKQGVTEEESINIAISKFGDIVEVRKELSEIIKIEAKFAKIILISAFALLFIWVASFVQESFMTEKDQFAYQGKAREVQMEIHELLEDKTVISEDDKAAMVTAIHKYNSINGIMFYGLTVEDSNGNVVFEEQLKDISNKEYGSNPSFEVHKPFSGAKWFVTLNSTREYSLNYPSWIDSYEREHFNYKFLLINMQGIVIAVYWVLFLLWFIIKAYHNKTIRLWNCIIVLLLNLVGYAIYVLINRIKNRRVVSNINS